MKRNVWRLPVPGFFDPKNAGRWDYRPDRALVVRTANEMRFKYGSHLWETDRFRVGLMIVDAQKDFCHPEGALYVAGRSGTGAIDDNARLASFILSEAPRIRKIIASFDQHPACHVNSPSFWVAPGPVMQNTRVEIRGSRIVNVTLDGTELWPVVASMAAEAACLSRGPNWLSLVWKYVTDSGGIMIWPYHCLCHTDGATFAGMIDEAVFFHGMLSETLPLYVEKGKDPLRDQYSVFGPDVNLYGARDEMKNRELLYAVFLFDAIVVAGQAKSHCVLASLKDMLAFAPFAASKVYVLQDCMSSVVIPGGPDFTDQTEAEYAKLAAAGMNLVNSTDPMETWPGVVGEYYK